MNEVTKIHLGRQAYAISNEAHHELRTYLDAIKRRVHDNDVVSEVELRMTELLSEHGVSGEKVILPEDVEYLKEQLGDPQDFAEDSGQDPADDKTVTKTKRLFRDTDNAMIAGVAAGLGNYFGVDALLVRLLFVIATFAGGWGILIYLVLWLLVPEARTPSEHLQMAGKPVTIDSLKEVVDRADVKGAAKRANNSLAGPINTAFRALLKIVGILFVIIGLFLLLGLTGFTIYAFLYHPGAVLTVFPVGLREHLLVYSAIAVLGILSLFVVLFGMAVFRRKWPIHAWITGTLVGLAFIGLATGSALTASVVPQVRSRYNANTHTTVRLLKPFTQVNTYNLDGDIDVAYQQSNTYSVSLRYFGHPNVSHIRTTVSHGTLVLNSQDYDDDRVCQTLCLPKGYDMTITIYAPQNPNFLDPSVAPPTIAPPPPSSVPQPKPMLQ